MAQIYTDSQGRQVYDYNGATRDAKTGQIISGTQGPANPFSSNAPSIAYGAVNTNPTQTPVTPAPPPATTISSNNLSSQQNLTIPPKAPATNYQPAAASSLEAILGAYNAPTAEEKNQNDLQQRIMNSLGVLGTESTRKGQLETEAGLPGQRTQLQDVMNKLQTLQKEAQAIPLQIQEESLGRGRTAAGVASIEDDRLRRNAIQTLSQSAVAQTLQGNISLAESNVQKALEAEFEPERQKLEQLKQLYEFNKDALKRADEKRTNALNLYIKERERILDQQQEDKSAAYAMALSAMNYYPNDPAAQRAAQEVLALDVNDPNYLSNVYNIVGQYQQDPIGVQSALLELEYKKAQTAKMYSDAKESASSAAAAGRVAAIKADYGTTGYYQQLFDASSGGKQLTGEQTTPLTKAAIVLNQVGELASQINTTTTDPILGILRDNNPYDVKARLIQAQLRATVPNLARGVYGEVGVLTNYDIENYIKTLPNIKSTAEANKLVLAMTLGAIKSSFEAYLETYANSGRDVSGFSRQYSAIDQKIQDIKSELGISSLSDSTDPYAQYRASLEPGEILVLRNGQPWAIQPSELNLKTDTFPSGPMNKI